MPYIIQIHYLEFAIFGVLYICGVGSKLSEELSKRRGRSHLKKYLMILYVVFVATELQPDTIFFQHFFA